MKNFTALMLVIGVVRACTHKRVPSLTSTPCKDPLRSVSP